MGWSIKILTYIHVNYKSMGNLYSITKNINKITLAYKIKKIIKVYYLAVFYFKVVHNIGKSNKIILII